jgi:hypothetical protein
VHSLIVDLPAKAMLLNIKQFNGEFGCVACFHPGQKTGTNSRVYPHDKEVSFLFFYLKFLALYKG